MNCYSREVQPIRLAIGDDISDFVNHGQALMIEMMEYCKERGFSPEDICDICITQLNAMRTSIAIPVFNETTKED